MPTTVTDTHKHPQVVATATATIAATDATWAEVVDAGLQALGESPDSLYGYGIRGVAPHAPESLTGSYVVYAHRD